MTKRNVAKRVAKDDGVTKDKEVAKIYKSKGKRGCRAYIGRKYLGYFVSEQAAHDALSSSKPTVKQNRVVEKVGVDKFYKYVITRQNKKGPTYQGAIWTQHKVDKQSGSKWIKKYFPRVKSPKAAAASVAETLETTLERIKVDKSSRKLPVQSANQMAFLWEGILFAGVRASGLCRRPRRQGGSVAGCGALDLGSDAIFRAYEQSDN